MGDLESRKLIYAAHRVIQWGKCKAAGQKLACSIIMNRYKQAMTAFAKTNWKDTAVAKTQENKLRQGSELCGLTKDTYIHGNSERPQLRPRHSWRQSESSKMLDNKGVATVTKEAVPGTSLRELGGNQGFFSIILILMRSCQKKT